MIKILVKYKKYLFPGALLMMLCGLTLIWLGMTQSVRIVKDGESTTVRTAALTVSGVLRSAGIPLNQADYSMPARDSWLWNRAEVRIKSARDIFVRTQQEEMILKTAERLPANLLLELGIALYPEDRVLLNGLDIDPHLALDDEMSILLQYEPAISIDVTIGDQPKTFHTSQPTLGRALEDAGVHLGPQDWISEDLSTVVIEPIKVSIRRARPVTVNKGGTLVTGLTAATTVGDALVDIGVPLQNLDYSLPDEDAPIPKNTDIKVIRISEELSIMTDEVAHGNDFVEDPNVPLDQVSVVETGQVGIFATRERIQVAQGEEIWRDEIDEWQASEPEPGVLARGSKIEVRTTVVDGQTIEYWRKISVYATWYSPCNCGTADGSCCFGSASGLPAGRGNIAVTPSWFRMMRLQPVFVQGYGEGFIGNTGGGASYFNHYWIDLGYDDDDTPPGSMGWTTMYFLTPVPDYVPTVLPWP